MSDAKNDEPTLRQSSISVSQMVEGSSDASFGIDDRNQIVAWSSSAEQLLGYSSEEALGRRCADILQAVLPGGEPLCMPDCELFRCFRNCHPRGVPNCRIRRKDGSWVSVAYSSMVMPGQTQEVPNGSVVAVVFLHEKEEQYVQVSKPGLLQIFTLGKFALAANGSGIALEKWKRRQAVTLLKILANNLDRPVHRERILDCLWPDVDEERGWGRLKVTIYYLRTQLRASGVNEDAVQTIGEAYLLRRDTVLVDAESFEKLVSEGRRLQVRGQIDEALRCYDDAQFLYRGDYLEQDVYADWCAEERGRLNEIYLEMLTRKAECHAHRSEFEEAAQVCRKALVHDPCRENFHCSLMQYLVQLGRADWAIAQYHRCQTVLAHEFGVEPMHEIQHLYRQILAQQKAGVSTELGAPLSRSTASSACN